MWEPKEAFGRRSVLRLTGGLVGAAVGGSALTGVGSAQTAGWTWQYRDRAGPSEAFDAVRTADGGYLVAGRVSFEPTDTTAWLAKLDADGGLEWSRLYGADDESDDEAEAVAVVELSDGYAFLRRETTYRTGERRTRLVVTDRTGEVRRSRDIGVGVDLVPATDGVVVLGTERADDGTSRVRLVKVDADLDVRWERSYGGERSLGPAEVVRLADGGYAVAATAWPTADCGDADYWLLRTDGAGECCWTRTYDNDGDDDDVAGLAERREDGETRGFALIGRSGDALVRQSGDVVWAVTVGPDGSRRSTRTFEPLSPPEDFPPRPADVEATDEGYVLFGDTVEQYWLAKTDRKLRPRWQEFYDTGVPWFMEHAATDLVTDGGEYGLVGSVYDGGDGNTAEAFVVHVVDDA